MCSADFFPKKESALFHSREIRECLSRELGEEMKARDFGKGEGGKLADPLRFGSFD